MAGQCKVCLKAMAAGALVVVAACVSVPRGEDAFRRAERANTTRAYEQFADSDPASPMAAEARKRALQLRENEAMALFKGVETATKASIVERFMRDHPYPKVRTLAKLRIAEIDYSEIEKQSPFRATRDGNGSWPGFINSYALSDYLPVPEDPQLRETYYRKLHPLLINALTQVNSFEAWVHYLATYPENPYFQQAAEQAEKYLATESDKWEGYEMLKSYLALYDEQFKRSCPNREALIRKFQDGLVGLVEKEATMEQLDRYLQTFPDSPHKKRIALLKDHIAFREAREKSDRATLKTLIERHKNDPGPLAQSDVREAISFLERAEHQDAIAAGTPKDLRAFKERYKDTDYSKLIPDIDQRLMRMHNQLLNKAKAERTAVGYQRFLEAFPDSPEKDDVLRRLEEALFNEVIAGSDRDRIRAVLARHPSSPFREKALNRIDDIDFEEERTAAVNEPSTYPLKRYLDRRPPGNHVTEAETLIAKLNQHNADYLAQLQRARETGNLSRLSSWIVDNQGNFYAARNGQRDLDTLKRDLAVQQLVSDLTTTLSVQSHGVLPVIPSRALNENSQALAFVETNTGSSTGFFFRRDGLLLTNARVVRNADPKRMTVKFGGRSLPCQVLSVAEATGDDLATLHVDATVDPIPMGNPALLVPNEKVICLATHGAKVESAEGTLLAIRRAGNTDWLVIQCAKINAALGGVIVNQKARAVGLLVRPDQVNPAVKENVPDCIYAISIQSALPLMEKAIRGQ